MRRLVPWVLLGVLTFVVLLGGGVALANQPDLSSKSNVGQTQTSGSVPGGWKTYTYGQAAISIPGNWVVRHDTNCPDGQAPGTLMLGFPKVLESCPEIPASASYVAMTLKTTGRSYVGFGSPSHVQQTSLGIEVIGTGADASRIFHTLRRA